MKKKMIKKKPAKKKKKKVMWNYVVIVKNWDGNIPIRESFGFPSLVPAYGFISDVLDKYPETIFEIGKI